MKVFLILMMFSLSSFASEVEDEMISLLNEFKTVIPAGARLVLIETILKN
jgi:hypothetical protein